MEYIHKILFRWCSVCFMRQIQLIYSCMTWSVRLLPFFFSMAAGLNCNRNCSMMIIFVYLMTTLKDIGVPFGTRWPSSCKLLLSARPERNLFFFFYSSQKPKCWGFLLCNLEHYIYSLHNLQNLYTCIVSVAIFGRHLMHFIYRFYPQGSR